MLGSYGGFDWYYPEDFDRTSLGSLVLQARSPDAAPVEVKLSGPAGACTAVDATLGAGFAAITVDLASACAGVPRLRNVQVQVMRGSGGTVVVDDVHF